jgi:hypothetical protein
MLGLIGTGLVISVLVSAPLGPIEVLLYNIHSVEDDGMASQPVQELYFPICFMYP